MARPELGIKRTCPTTGRKFYDLNKDPIVSPYTGDVVPRASLEPPRAMGGRARPAPVDDEEAEVAPAGPEVISLEDVADGEEAKAGEDESIDDEAVTTDDTFLEDEEEGGDDVADLIDSDIEDDEEA